MTENQVSHAFIPQINLSSMNAFLKYAQNDFYKWEHIIGISAIHRNGDVGFITSLVKVTMGANRNIDCGGVYVSFNNEEPTYFLRSKFENSFTKFHLSLQNITKIIINLLAEEEFQIARKWYEINRDELKEINFDYNSIETKRKQEVGEKKAEIARKEAKINKDLEKKSLVDSLRKYEEENRKFVRSWRDNHKDKILYTERRPVKKDVKACKQKSIKSRAIKAFENFKIDALWHMSDFNNIPNICKLGILSHNESHRIVSSLIDISDPGAQRWRKGKEPFYGRRIHSYAALYINVRNPMLYVKKDQQAHICFLEICPSVLDKHQFIITNGNAASATTALYQSLSELNMLPWDVLNASSWTDKPDGKRKRCAEVLVYPKVPKEYIKRIHCYSDEVLHNLDGIDIPVVITPNLYF